MLILILILIKCKFHPRTGHEGTDGSKNSSIISSTSALDEVGGSAPRPGPFNPRKETRYPLYWGAPVPVWTGAENLAYTGIRSPDRPVRSELLYRLRYPGPLNNATIDNNTNAAATTTTTTTTNNNNNNNLTVAIQLMWNVNTEVMPVIVETAGTISTPLRKT